MAIVIFATIGAADYAPGNSRYSGGTKVYNGLVKVLRKHGVEAYTATYDGTYPEWLIEHAPHVSLEQIRSWKDEGREVKIVTGWLESHALLGVADEFYYLDCELTHTIRDHRHLLDQYIPRIKGFATNSRTQQAWYMATLGIVPTLLRDASDRDCWHPRPEIRQEGLVGYMNEQQPPEDMDIIVAHGSSAGLNLQFQLIQGYEADVLDWMQRCDVFLGLNPGKHSVWGEGCPRSPQEAMHAGAVVIAYGVHGNEEYLIDGFSGYLVPCGHPYIMGKRLVWLMQNREEKERVRRTSCELAERAFSLESRWPVLRDWLGLQ